MPHVVVRHIGFATERPANVQILTSGRWFGLRHPDALERLFDSRGRLALMTGEGRYPDRVPMRDSPEEAPRQQRGDAPVTRPETPVPVRVWVTQRQTGEFEANGYAVAWTDRQVEVRYDDPHGREGFAWVWASAVTRRAD